MAGRTKSTARLWFRYLKAAHRMNLSVDWERYREWGTPQEIQSLTFNAWWEKTGKLLFPLDTELTVEDRGDFVVVTIPKRFSAVEVRQAMKSVTPYLQAGKRAGIGAWKADGKVRYADFARYLRLLEIELSPSKHHEPMKRKVEQLEKDYAVIHGKLKNRNSKMLANGGKRKGYKGIRAPRIIPNITAATGYRWLKKATAIAKDVAKGTFPGRGFRKS